MPLSAETGVGSTVFLKASMPAQERGRARKCYIDHPDQHPAGRIDREHVG